jgi:RNA polymerase sigma factor (sigma-70 family)
MADLTCEEFYFQRIALAEASPDDYREFFSLLWHANGQSVFQHAYSRLGNVEDARDVCQDAFLKAMVFLQKNPGRIPTKVNFRAWLRAIACNLINDRFRRALLKPAALPKEVLETLPVEQPPEARLTTADDLAAMKKCLDSLSPQAQAILRLREVEGKSEKEVAAAVHSNPNAVCVALHRARKSLRECIRLRERR